MIRITPIVKTLLVINVILFLADYLMRGMLNNMFALQFILSEKFLIVQFLTYMWLHGDFWHLFFNMIMLFFLGGILEEYWGGKRFLQYYLLTGVGAGLIYALVQFGLAYQDISAASTFLDNPTAEAYNQFITEGISGRLKGIFSPEYVDKILDINNSYYENPESPEIREVAEGVGKEIWSFARTGYGFGGMVGASGAIYGLLFAAGFLFPEMTIRLIIPPVPVKMKYLVFFLGAYAIWSQFNRGDGDNVAHLAHLTGMLIGFIILKLWKNSSN